MLKKNVELGSFVSNVNDRNKMYMIVSSKSKNKCKLITCLPIIDKIDRKETDRYVYGIFCDKLLVINKPENFFNHQLHYEKARMAKYITKEIIEKYKNYDPDLHDVELGDISTDDGLRSGNPWEGLSMMGKRPKIYKG